MRRTQMKRVKSELFKYSNISMDHLSPFAWLHAFIYMPFTCFVYMFIPICTILPQAPMLNAAYHLCQPPTTNTANANAWPQLGHVTNKMGPNDDV